MTNNVTSLWISADKVSVTYGVGKQQCTSINTCCAEIPRDVTTHACSDMDANPMVKQKTLMLGPEFCCNRKTLYSNIEKCNLRIGIDNRSARVGLLRVGSCQIHVHGDMVILIVTHFCSWCVRRRLRDGGLQSRLALLPQRRTRSSQRGQVACGSVDTSHPLESEHSPHGKEHLAFNC